MKRMLHIAIIALFMAALWVPLVGTPFWFRREQQAMMDAEKRLPNGSLSLAGRDMDNWVRDVQDWYEDSFAFRKKLMNVYHIAHYLIQNYPDAYFGTQGYVFKKGLIDRGLVPVSEAKWTSWSRNLDRIQQLRDETGIPVLFIIIPSKETIHPELTPGWLRPRTADGQRQRLTHLIREKNLPVLDLTPVLRANAKQTRRTLVRKYDDHWSLEGSLVGYREMISAIREFVPETRFVSPSQYSMELDERSTEYSKKYYLEPICSEPLMTIKDIYLPPVKIIRGRDTWHQTVCKMFRRHTDEVFCEGLGDHTVVFIRDSFLNMPSPLLNHSFAHTVYLNNSDAGRNPGRVVAVYKPDLLVFALQEKTVGRYLDRMDE